MISFLSISTSAHWLVGMRSEMGQIIDSNGWQINTLFFYRYCQFHHTIIRVETQTYEVSESCLDPYRFKKTLHNLRKSPSCAY